MKQSLFFLTILLVSSIGNAQNPNYNSLWDKVKNYELEGLPKSALNVVEEISELAKKDKNTAQQIKTLLFKSKFALVLEEDAQLSIINEFKTEISSSNFPKKNMLENMLAHLYWQYFNQNRYTFYNRTKTAEKVDSEDFRTWDLQTLFHEIHIHYQNSLENGLMLQLEPLEKYNEILIVADNSKQLRPTLFDFLSHNALDFYKTNETSITKPAYKFEIDNTEFLGDAITFSTLPITSKDTASLQLHALKIYQNLIRFHSKDKDPLALTEVNIERLQFVKQQATFKDKDTLLSKTLKTERDHINTHGASGLYDFEIASILHQQGLTYQPKTNIEHRWKTKEAFDICNNVITKYPQSKAAEKCSVLKEQVEQQSLQITTEDFLPIQQDSRLLIRYKNINNLHFKVFKLSQKEFKTFNSLYNEVEQLAFIKALDNPLEWTSLLKNELDYQTHTMEVLLPKLDNGRYLIFASPEKEKEETFAFSTIQVTNLALVEKDNLTNHIFQIIDRTNGKPITNTKTTLRFYQNNSKSYSSKDFTTNSRGEIIIEKDNEYFRDLTIEVRANNDKAFFGNYYINKFYKNEEEKVNYKSFVFTDRSIYRPGQTVYFKAIAMKTLDGKSEVLANHKMMVTLYDANNQELKELELVTNEFGSVSGEFMLPNSGLNGDYYIEFDSESGSIDISTEQHFSVEEYKRPKFETKFNPVTETFKVNDSVTIKGSALAYAGSTITDAKVVFRVHRKIEYPRWYFWYRPWVYSEPQEITHGETVTDASGNFEIGFKAIPDQSVDKNSLPVFNYEITADVTDLNGETRSATTIVNVGYHALVANLSIESQLDKTKKDHQLSIDTKNLNGAFVPANGVVKIYKLQAPKDVLRIRPWAAPDYQAFSEQEFKSRFPHDAYDDEDQPDQWKKGNLVFEHPFDTEKSKTLELGNIKKWPSGLYTIVLETKDRFGQTVKDEIKTTLYSNEDKTLADHQLFSITTNKSSYNAGEKALLTLASAAQNITVTITVEKNHKTVNTYIVQLNHNKKTISLPVTKEDIGGFAVNYSFAAFNSYQSGTELIAVPYPNTELNIETTTFRDKLQPGQDETWSFKIKGPQGDQVSAELLASMYDASLDQFKAHAWDFNPINKSIYYSYNQSNANRSFGTKNFRVYNESLRIKYQQQNYVQWNWFDFYFNNGRRYDMLKKSLNGRASGVQIVEDNVELEEVAFAMDDSKTLNEVVTIGYAVKNETTSKEEKSNQEKPDFDTVQIRKNLQETAFFFPQLQTDENGNISFSFTTPEALTQWKLQLLAHTKTFESATKTLTTVTQKELMVIPNVPRFFRQGDQISISTKITNLTENPLAGQAILLLTDAVSGNAIDSKLDNNNNTKSFVVDAKGNTQVSWSLSIPEDVDAVQYKIIAKSDSFSDGEQNALPVLSNRILVTESLPMWIRSNQTRTFSLDKLKTNTSTTLKNHKLTLEMTSNPAWYAVQSLPYLMEYPYDCNEQTFSRYYANALASHIANSNPRIQEVFNQWKSQDALISNLEKNEDLKSILIQETPWLRDAQSDTEQKKRMALLFDLNKMTYELQSAIRKLENNQMGSGAWPWFTGGEDSRYITQHIVTGFGHLKKLGVDTSGNSKMIERAINYLDTEFIKEYNALKKFNPKVVLSNDHLSYTQLHYLYMRSFYPDIKTSHEVEDIINYYDSQIKKYWLRHSLYAKGLMALISERLGDKTTSTKIIKSLKETSITSDELGMYWKVNSNSWYWYQAPIETQALLIEAFQEIENDTKTIDNLKIWLLKNKQTNQWKTTKATTEAVYALLLQGSDWLSVTDMVDVVIGGQKIEPSKLEDVKTEAGTGYYKTAWSASDIKPEMANVTLTKIGDGIAWGSLYWQYFEDLDKITSAETPLKLTKKLFLKKNTDTGELISEITAETKLKVGDLVRVRIELKSDRVMEFIHMKDMRASGLEPISVISKYKWQDGLGYYESTKDAATNFFFDYLPKGVYVFEYDLRISNAGDMSNGITTIQSMYAPEFNSHSDGTRIFVE